MDESNNTKNKIVQTALQLFNDQGTRAVTTNHIAAAAGISPGNLYYHFRNKDEIIRTIFTEIVTDLENKVPGNLDNKNDLTLSRVETQLQATLVHKWNYRFFYRELNSLTNNDDGLKKSFIALQETQITAIENNLRGLSRSGILKKIDDQAVKSLATSIWVIALFWLSFLEVSGEDISIERLATGIELIRDTLKPYFA